MANDKVRVDPIPQPATAPVPPEDSSAVFDGLRFVATLAHAPEQPPGFDGLDEEFKSAWLAVTSAQRAMNDAKSESENAQAQLAAARAALSTADDAILRSGDLAEYELNPLVQARATAEARVQALEPRAETKAAQSMNAYEAWKPIAIQYNNVLSLRLGADARYAEREFEADWRVTVCEALQKLREEVLGLVVDANAAAAAASRIAGNSPTPLSYGVAADSVGAKEYLARFIHDHRWREKNDREIEIRRPTFVPNPNRAHP